MKFRYLLAVLALLALIILATPIVAPSQAQTLWTKFRNVHVEHNLDVDGDVDIDGTLNADGVDFDSDLDLTGDLTVTGNATVTGDTALGDAAGDTTTVTGDMTIAGARDGTANYDYFLTIEGDATGVANNAKTYGLYVSMERTENNTGGNIDDAAAKLRIKTSATSRTAGIVQNALDAESKTDDDHHAGTIRGAQVTAVGDAGSTTDTAVALRAHAEMSGDVTNLQVADFELNRKDATEPTTEYGINVRNTSSAGQGADVGYRLETSAGAGGADANADWTYGIDLNPAVVTTADIRLQNEEYIANTTDGTITMGGIVAPTGDISMENGELISNDTDGTIDVEGNFLVSGARDADTEYDYFLTVEGDVTGTASGAKTYGMYVDMERTVANVSGNIDDAGIKVRYKNSAPSRVAGIVQTGADIEAKNDDGHATGTLRGAQITAVGDAGSTSDSVVALRAHAEMSGDATDLLQVADFELNRKDATDPTASYGLNIRNTSSAGGGADTALRIESSYGAGGSSADDDWAYGIDMASADATTADIRLQNEETIANTTNGLITLGGDFNATGSYDGNLTVAGARDDTSDYDYFLTVEGDVTGTLSGAKTYGLFVDMERTANSASGNIDDAGVKVRYKTSATSRTAGIVETGGDFEGKVDDGHKAGTIRGVVATAVLDDSATADAQVPFRAHAEIADGATATAVQVGDFELNRKSSNEPTTEYGINLRNTSSAGTGADVGYRLESSYGAGGSSDNADWVYGVDLSPADIVTADIRLSNGESINNVTDGYIGITGSTQITATRVSTTGYENLVKISGEATGVAENAKTRGLLIDVNRPAGSPTTHGNIDDTALKVTIDSDAATTTTGGVQQGIDVVSKADNNSDVSVLRGAQFTADTDAGSEVEYAYGAHIYVEQEGDISDMINVLDVELKRKDADDATNEWGINIRNTSELGGGADVALRIESAGSGAAANDDWAYGIDMSEADLTTDIRLQNGETISNNTDTAVQIGGFLALTEGNVIDLGAGGTITPAASYQPITNSTEGSIDTSATTAIADGAVAGTLLIICNEDAQNVVIKDGANTDIGGDQTLTGGAGDCISLIWNGDNWNMFATMADN